MINYLIYNIIIYNIYNIIYNIIQKLIKINCLYPLRLFDFYLILYKIYTKKEINFYFHLYNYQLKRR